MEHMISILNTLPAPAILWDIRTGGVLHVNQPAAVLLSHATGLHGADCTGFSMVPSLEPRDMFAGHEDSIRPLAEAEVILETDGGSVIPLSGWMYFPYNNLYELDGTADRLIFLPVSELTADVRRTVRIINLDTNDRRADPAGSPEEAADPGYVRHIIEAFPGMVFIKGLNGRYIDCSDAFAKFVHLESPEDIVGKTSYDVLPHASAEWSVRLDNMMFDKLQPTSEIYPFSSEDGTLTDWQRVSRAPLRNSRGELIGLVGSLESVGSVMKLTEELTMAKARFLALSEVMSYNSFVLILWNVDTLAVDYISDSVTYLGFKTAHFSGMSDWAALVHPDDRDEYYRLRKPLHERHLHIDFWHEYRLVNRRGEVRWMQERVSSVMAPASHLYRSIIIDTTARHEQENIGKNMVLEGAEIHKLNMGNVHLLDIVSREYLQERSDHVANALGLSSSIIDTTGAPLTDKTGVCELCSMIRGSERGATLCQLSDVNIGIAARDADGLIVAPCETLGLYVAAAPIMMGGKHLGTWIVGRARTGDMVDQRNVRALSERLNLNPDTAVKAFLEMPEWDATEIMQIFSLLPPFVQELSDFAHRSYMLMYETEKIVKSQESLARGSDIDAMLTELSRIFFQIDRDGGERMTEAAQLLCDYYGFGQALVVERSGRGYGITHQWHRQGRAPVSAAAFTQEDMNSLSGLCRVSGTVVQLPVAGLPEVWRTLCESAQAENLLFRILESGGRPTAAVLFMQGGDRLDLSSEELYFLNQLMAPVMAFILMQQSELRMKQTTSSLKLVINSMRSAVYVIDRENYEVLFANDHFDGNPTSGPRGLACFRLLGHTGPCACCGLDMMRGMPDGYTYTYETNERVPGCWHAITITAIEWMNSRPVYLIRVRDITDEKYQQEQLLYASTFDMLLNIPTIGRLNARLDTLLHEGKNGYLFTIDIDNLQLINNAYGHQYGDALLQEIVLFLKSSLPMGEYVYRYATGTLALLLEDADRNKANKFMSMLNKRFIKAWQIKDKQCFATFSTGVVCYPGGCVTLIDLMRDVDTALQRSIDRARNSFFVSELHEHSNAADRMELANDLHAMVSNGCTELVIHYQPIYDFSKGRITHCEAFMRWEHPERGLIPPLKFLDIAEHTSLIVPLSEALLDQVINQCKLWQDNGHDVGVSVNFSAVHSRQEGIAPAIGASLSKAGLSPDYLQIELSEAFTINDRQHMLHFSEELRNMGCRIAIDNFGTDLSALGTFNTDPVDVIKIDRGFVFDICENEYHSAVVSFAVNAARICGMEVTCKGIENTAQLERVREMGVDHMQGFLLSPPLPADKLTELLSNPLPEALSL